MKYQKLIILTTIVINTLILSSSLSLSQVPAQVNFQGQLKTNEGHSLPNGDYDFIFSIYDSQTSTTPLWVEEHVVTVTDSIYKVLLGIYAPLTSDLFDSGAAFLEIRIFNDTGTSTGEWEVLYPRMPLTSTPYSIRAGDADTLSGLDPSAYDQSDHAMNTTGNPHKITPAMIGALEAKSLDAHAGNESAHHAKTTSFSELTDFISVSQIPGDMATDKELDTGITNHDHDNRYYSQAHVDALETRIASLEATVSNLLARFSGVTRNGEDITFSGVNVHIVNGTGTTSGDVNGLGNLIVGYNELRGSGDDRSGSHNIVSGARNNYSSFGGFVAGNYNAISGDYASVSGGNANTASGSYSSISGGTGSIASGLYASVSGGAINMAIGNFSSISGGGSNRATGSYTYIGGGGGQNQKYGNIAVADYSAILGGLNNLTGNGTRSYDSDLGRNVMAEAAIPDHSMGILATVNGGVANHATGESSSVSGGSSNDAIGNSSSVSGGSSNDAIGNHSSVSGGSNNEAIGGASSVSGGSSNDAVGGASSVSGGGQNIASESYSSVSGGRDNFAGGYASSVGGGSGNEASQNYSSVSGGRYNNAIGNYSSVSGGYHNEASGEHSSVSGGYQRSVSGDEDWRAGDLFQDY